MSAHPGLDLLLGKEVLVDPRERGLDADPLGRGVAREVKLTTSDFASLLPDDAFLVDQGPTRGLGKSAVFLVSTATGTTGEGDCEPDDTCTFLYMKSGQTQSFEAVDENDQVVTYKLKLIETNVEETEAPKEAEVVDLVAALRASVEAAKKRREASAQAKTG